MAPFPPGPCLLSTGTKKGAGKKAAKKKGGGLDAAEEAALAPLVGCLALLTAASSADAYRVAAAGLLPQLVELWQGVASTRLRRAAQVGRAVAADAGRTRWWAGAGATGKRAPAAQPVPQLPPPAHVRTHTHATGRAVARGDAGRGAV